MCSKGTTLGFGIPSIDYNDLHTQIIQIPILGRSSQRDDSVSAASPGHPGWLADSHCLSLCCSVAAAFLTYCCFQPEADRPIPSWAANRSCQPRVAVKKRYLRAHEHLKAQIKGSQGPRWEVSPKEASPQDRAELPSADQPRLPMRGE